MCPNDHKAQNLDNLNYISFCIVIYFETVVNKNAPLGSISGSTSSDESGFTNGHYCLPLVGGRVGYNDRPKASVHAGLQFPTEAQIDCFKITVQDHSYSVDLLDGEKIHSLTTWRR